MSESPLFSFQYAYTEEYEQQRGKGSFPAHLTPGYKMSKKATEQASDVSRQSKNKIDTLCTQILFQSPHNLSVMDFLSSQIKYRQMYEQEIRGKASAEVAVAEAAHAKENAENFSQVRNKGIHVIICSFKFFISLFCLKIIVDSELLKMYCRKRQR